MAWHKIRRGCILWGVSTSRTLRALWALHELSLDYTGVPSSRGPARPRPPSSPGSTRAQKIPVLQDGDFTIAESPAIIAYLSDTYGTPENRLVPPDPRQRATGWNGVSTSP